MARAKVYKNSLCRFSMCKSMADTDIIDIDLYGNSYGSVPNTERNRLSLARKLREFADALEMTDPLDL